MVAVVVQRPTSPFAGCFAALVRTCGRSVRIFAEPEFSPLAPDDYHIVAVTYTVGFAKGASWCGGIVWTSSSGPPCVSRAPGETGGKGSEPRWGGVTLKRPQLPACAACWPFGERASWDLGCMNYLLKRFSCNARLTSISSGSLRASSAFRDDVRGDTRRAVGISRYL